VTGLVLGFRCAEAELARKEWDNCFWRVHYSGNKLVVTVKRGAGLAQAV
jgi:hypothetical protein